MLSADAELTAVKFDGTIQSLAVGASNRLAVCHLSHFVLLNVPSTVAVGAVG